MKKINFNHILTALFLLSVFFLALNKVEDTDAWTHLSIGKLIWESKGIPDKEFFLYTYHGQPLATNAWLFELIYYLAYNAFNLYGVILLKAAIVTLAFAILFADALRPHRNYAAAVVILTSIVLVSRHRFVERPDTFLMVFLSFTAFALNSYLYEGKKYLYAMPVVAILWANSHPSVILMFVPFAAFIFGGLMQGLANKKYSIFHDTPSKGQIITVAGIFLLSVAASFITPNPVWGEIKGAISYVLSVIFPSSSGQVSSGAATVLSSDWWSQEIVELKKPTWELMKAPYILTIFLAISFALNFRRFSLMHLLFVVPFVYLSLTAVRFVFILAVVAGPLIVRNLSCFLDHPETVKILRHKAFQVFVIMWVVAYSALTVAGVEPFVGSEKVFGFGINDSTVPEGALKYMDRRGIEGKIFNQFHWGGYITWRDFPKRRAFVDGRGVGSQNLLEKMGKARWNDIALDELDDEFRFDAVLLEYTFPKEGTPEIYGEQDIALSSHKWALVYWDDISLVYLKKGGKYDSIIQKDSYWLIKPANGEYSLKKNAADADLLKAAEEELKRSINENGSSRAYAFLGFLYNEAGRYNDAIEAFLKVKDHSAFSHMIWAYNGLAFANGKLGRWDDAIDYYKRSAGKVKDAVTYYNIANLYLAKKEIEPAIKYLKIALDEKPNFIEACDALVSSYGKLGMSQDAEKALIACKGARVDSKAEEHFKKGTQALMDGRHKEAIQEFEHSIKANPYSPAPYSNLGYIYFDIGFYDKALEYHKKAAAVDARFANAYYGIALVYKKYGNLELARKNWEEYLRLEPSGYYSRRAKEELSR
ncbi:MAG: tetratricopeptide repeat protein [Nitrospirae bacterium]|nr:tetratricopeptide repeat protein [Nitrospirota bacterium]